MARPAFIDLQYRFTAHMRDPEQCPPPPGIEARRLALYRDLLYRNVEGCMANAFPVLRRITADEHWHAMIRDYYSRHRARTALFPRMPQEFLRYLAEERDEPADPPFLHELAHYEWLEADVSFDTRELDAVAVDTGVDLLDGCAIPNPVMRPAAYRFPVHRIGPGLQPSTLPAEPTYLVVFRRRDDTVGFMELNAVSARLLELLLRHADTPGRDLLHRIAVELAHPMAEAIVTTGRDMLETFLRKEIILGVRRP